MNEGSVRMSKMKKIARTMEENKLKRVTDEAKKEYLESICDEIMGFESTGYDVLMCMKTRELDWKENHGIQTTNIEDSPGNIKVDQRQVLKIWENYITKLYNWATWPENIGVEPEEKANADKKGPYILHSEVGKAV